MIRLEFLESAGQEGIYWEGPAKDLLESPAHFERGFCLPNGIAWKGNRWAKPGTDLTGAFSPESKRGVNSFHQELGRTPLYFALTKLK
jgi:hypothetical protein